MPPIGTPNDREQIINFLLARGDERDKTINDLQEANGVLRNQITNLQNDKDALQKKLDQYEATKASEVPPPTAEATA